MRTGPGRARIGFWLLPWIRKSFRWNSEVRIRYKRSHAKGAPNNWLLYRFQELAIPSERFDCIDVIYIDSERRFFAAGQDRPPLSEYGSLLPKSIYKQWIQVPAPQFVPSPEWVDFTVPHFQDGSVTFERRPFSQQPGPILPISQLDAKQRLVIQSWPPLLIQSEYKI